jgi:hypothetical protein
MISVTLLSHAQRQVPPQVEKIKRTLEISRTQDIAVLQDNYYTSKHGQRLIKQLINKYIYYINQAETNELNKVVEDQDSVQLRIYRMADRTGIKDKIITVNEILYLNRLLENRINDIVPYDVRLRSTGFYQVVEPPTYEQSKKILMKDMKKAYFHVITIGKTYKTVQQVEDSIMTNLFPVYKRKSDATDIEVIEKICRNIDINSSYDKVITPTEYNYYMKYIHQHEDTTWSKFMPLVGDYCTTVSNLYLLKELADTLKQAQPEIAGVKAFFTDEDVEALRFVLQEADRNKDMIISDDERLRVEKRFNKKGKL